MSLNFMSLIFVILQNFCPAERDKVFFFNSYFYSKLLEGGSTPKSRHSAVERWTNRLLISHPLRVDISPSSSSIDSSVAAFSNSVRPTPVTPTPASQTSGVRRFIWEFDVVVFPLNHTGAHWTLALVCFPYLALKKPPDLKSSEEITPAPPKKPENKTPDPGVSETDLRPPISRASSVTSEKSWIFSGRSEEPVRSQRRVYIESRNTTPSVDSSATASDISEIIRREFGRGLFGKALSGIFKGKRKTTPKLVEPALVENGNELMDIAKSGCSVNEAGDNDSKMTKRLPWDPSVEVMNVCSSDEEDFVDVFNDYPSDRTCPISQQSCPKQSLETPNLCPNGVSQSVSHKSPCEFLNRSAPFGVTRPAIFHLDSLEETPGPPDSLKEHLVDYFKEVKAGVYMQGSTIFYII